MTMVHVEEKARRSNLVVWEDERRKPKSKSLKKRAITASTRITHSLKKHGSQVADCRYSWISVEDVRDAEEEAAVNDFRKTLAARDLLPPLHDDYHTMLRCDICSLVKRREGTPHWKAAQTELSF